MEFDAVREKGEGRVVIENAHNGLKVDVVELSLSWQLALNALQLHKINLSIFLEHAETYLIPYNVGPIEVSIENFSFLINNANVTGSIARHTGKEISVFFGRGVFFALWDLDSRVYVHIVIDELSRSVKEVDLLRSIQRKIVDDDSVCNCDLEQIVLHLKCALFLFIFLVLLLFFYWQLGRERNFRKHCLVAVTVIFGNSSKIDHSSLAWDPLN